MAAAWHRVALRARPAPPSLAKLNEKCAKAGVYNALMMKQVAVWTEIRNKADHGHFKEYVAADVVGMVSGVTGILAAHL